MMISWSGVVFFALLGVIVSASPRRHRSRARVDAREECPTVYSIPCQADAECGCSSRRLICNYAHVCREISIFDISARQRCPQMFKSRCDSSDDCQDCPSMVCVARECVYDKNKLI